MAASRGDAAEGLTWQALNMFDRAKFGAALFQFHQAARTGYQPAQMNAAWMYQVRQDVTRRAAAPHASTRLFY